YPLFSASHFAQHRLHDRHRSSRCERPQEWRREFHLRPRQRLWLVQSSPDSQQCSHLLPGPWHGSKRLQRNLNRNLSKRSRFHLVVPDHHFETRPRVRLHVVTGVGSKAESKNAFSATENRERSTENGQLRTDS